VPSLKVVGRLLVRIGRLQRHLFHLDLQIQFETCFGVMNIQKAQKSYFMILKRDMNQGVCTGRGM
jgi:hypothetical protein